MDLDTDAHATFIYDKEAHGIKLQGKEIQDANGTTVAYEPASFPQGIWVNYTITKIIEGDGVTVIPPEKQKTSNGYQAIDAGTYIVCAQFEGEDERNYHPIPDAIARLTIERGEYDMSNVTLKDATFVYTGETYSVEKQDLEKEDAYVSFFYNYFEAVKNGDCDAIADMYASDYENVPSDFTVQMIYDMQISQSMDYESGLVFRVDYKIYRNNGTFRDDVGSDTTRSLSFTLIREGETLKFQSIRPYTSYVRN
jgi:hypothetical protein